MDGYGSETLPTTLLMPALSDLRSFTRVYLDRFGADSPTVGQAVLVRGEHGSGKTHAIGYLIGKVKSRSLGAESTAGEVVQLYAKAEAGDIVAVYRSLLARLSLATLRELALRFTAEIAGAAIVAGVQGEKPKDLFERLRMEPQLFKEMLRVYYVDESELLRRRDDEITRLTGESTDFVNAFSWIDSEIGELAHRWLVGDSLDAEERRQLGVSGTIDTVATTQSGLRLLAALCARSDRPLIVYIDQYEKLVLEDGGQLNLPNAGAIHTLAEAIPQEDAMLILSGNDEAWDALPLDLQQRFGPRVVECRGFGLDEAAALVALYLHPRGEAQTERPIDFEQLRPFTEDGFKLLHLYSGGNARRLLELCAVAYDASGPDGVIDRAQACVAANEAGSWRADVASTIETMMRVARSRGYTVRGSKDLPAEVQDALVLSVAGRDRIQVVLGQAAHYYTEVIEAASFVTLADELRAVDPGVQIILVILGYETAEICAALTRVGIEVVRFRPPTFAADFDAALEQTAHRQPEETVMGDHLASEVREARSELAALRLEREADTRGLVTQTTTIDAHYEQERVAERWEQATRDWISERGRLEGGIREARQRRRASELDELSRFREHAESARRNRQLWASVALLLGLVIAIVGFLELSQSTEFEFGARATWSLLFGFLGLAILSVPFAGVTLNRWNLRDAFRRSRGRQELALPVSSAEDLQRVARRASAERAPLWSYLSHENPQVRFVAALIADDYDEVESLAEALLGERCALVRNAYAKRVGDLPEVAWRALDSLALADTLEAAYILEGTLRRGLPPFPLHEHPRLSHLAAIMSSEVAISPATRILAAADSRGLSETDCRKLDAAIAAGLPLSARADLIRLSADSLRVAARVVSPFEDGALGTLDALIGIDDVDSAFLVLSQLLFMSELGLLVNYP
jgi:hypothetical protein